jgi:hypothetical protein
MAEVSMSEHSLPAADARLPETQHMTQHMTQHAFGKMLFGNVLVIAVVLILMAIFLV